MRAMSWRPAAFFLKGTSNTLRSYFAAGSYFAAARAPSGNPAAAPSALMPCRNVRRCIASLPSSLELEVLAVVMAMVLLAAGRQRDVITAHFAVHRHRVAVARQHPREILE